MTSIFKDGNGFVFLQGDFLLLSTTSQSLLGFIYMNIYTCVCVYILPFMYILPFPLLIYMYSEPPRSRSSNFTGSLTHCFL